MTKHLEEYFFKEGCYIEEWLNDPSEEDCSVARVRVEPKVTTRLHKLADTTERYIILQGTARVTVGEKQWHVTAKDVVTIPPNVPQCIQNLEKTDLVFLAVCSPRFINKNYTDLSGLEDS
jgi:mannose-6-phosphate isomerase-like protein (cupin superfamily)